MQLWVMPLWTAHLWTALMANHLWMTDSPPPPHPVYWIGKGAKNKSVMI